MEVYVSVYPVSNLSGGYDQYNSKEVKLTEE